MLRAPPTQTNPPSMHVTVILNPQARSGRAGRLRPAVDAALRAGGWTPRWMVTTRPGEGRTMAEQAAATSDVVVAMGGDGTVHEVGGGLVRAGTRAVLGVVPAGTGNDFARMLGLPRRPVEAAAALPTAGVHAVDAGRVRWRDGHAVREDVFLNAVGVGFDAYTAHLSAGITALPGILRYLAAVFRALRTFTPPSMTLADPAGDGGAACRYAGPLLLVTIGNGRSSGGGFVLTPDASLHDGLLDVCRVTPCSIRRILQVLPRTLTGDHGSAPEVRMGRTASLTVDCPAGVPLHVDGEVLSLEAREVAADVLPGRLRVLGVDVP